MVTQKTELIRYKNKWGRIINKSIDDGISIETEKVSIAGQRTIEIGEKVINAMANDFFPSLIQRLIEKEYEVRIFYFDRKFSSIAIFSQSNAESEIDGRRLNPEHLTRHVPFLLPANLREKICVLMGSLNLNYGSIDLIKSSDGSYYFLEVNPYGQFGYLSSFANYYLEHKIATYL
ncbi:hypothetical protein LWM68_15550 [Niabella sp. W65]|nr:hypothetical protein [Niabella sp. W65]MCH7364044.1 hypothetical protein [Niabella sp. W65]ULT39921.1 hypothetical protein KRR40_34350 [Niabella sp. I65]